MASITKRGMRWRVRVRKHHEDISATFRTKAEAMAWAAQQEVDATAGKLGKLPDHSFGELLERYRDTVSVHKDGKRWEALRLTRLVRDDPLAQIRLTDIKPAHLADWRDRRLREVSVGTVLREWNLLSAACTRAVKEWGWLRVNPFSGVKRPAEPPARTRRISQDEIERLIQASGYGTGGPLLTSSSRVGAAILLAIETALRAGELCALRWADIDVETRVLQVRATAPGARKTGQARAVPLSSAALAVLDRLRGIDAVSVLELKPASLDALFRRIRDKAMVTGAHFHDTRAEALTRLSKRLDVMQLARVSGHKDIQLLFRVYYRETAEDMARLLE
jgi:integrase